MSCLPVGSVRGEQTGREPEGFTVRVSWAGCRGVLCLEGHTFTGRERPQEIGGRVS